MFCLVCCSVDNVTVFNLIKKQIGWEMAHISKETFAVFQVLFLMLQILFSVHKIFKGR